MTTAEYKAIEHLIGLALSADEAGQRDRALSLYREVEQRIFSLVDRLTAAKDYSRHEKLDAYLANVVTRKEALMSRAEKATYPSAPPLPPPPCSSATPTAPYEQLLRLSSPTVQMCAVTAEGAVSVPSYPTYLEINAFAGPEGATFMQLGDWRCPLVAGETPILLTGEENCTLMMPDPSSLRRGDSVAVFLPRDLHPYERSALLQQLARIACLMVFDGNGPRPLTEAELAMASPPPPPPPQTTPPSQTPPPPPPSIAEDEGSAAAACRASTVAQQITAASEALAKGLQWGAQKGGQAIGSTGQALRQRLQRPHTAGRPVDPRVVEGAAKVREGSHAVVRTTEMAVTGLASVIGAAAQWAAPHVRRGAQQMLPQKWTAAPADGGLSKTDKAFKVAAATVGGVGTVWEALEESAKTIGRSVAAGTTNVVTGRYGNATGAVTENVMYSVGNAGMSVRNLRLLGPKALATKAASETVQNYNGPQEDQTPMGNGDEKQNKKRQAGPQK